MLKIQRNKGIYHYNRGEYNSSRQCFAESLQLLQAFYNDNHPETAQMLLSLGEVDEALGNFEESLKHKADALKMLQSLYREDHPAKARALLSIGNAYASMGQLEASREHKQDALKMFKDLCGKSHPEVARALLSLGDVHAALENFEASQQHKEDSLEMFQDLYGSWHPEVARVLLSLGEMYALSGKLEESLKHKEDSWKMFQSFYREDHPEVVQALGSLNETRGRLIQDAGSSRQDTGHALSPVRTVYPQHLTLLPTPRHGKEPAGENTLLRNYYQHETFACVPSLFDEQDSKHVKDLECQLMLREQKLMKEDKDKKEDEEGKGDKEQSEGSSKESQVASHHARLEEVKTPIALQDLFKKRSIKPGEPAKEIQRILLTGDPGTGKTTVSKQLAYQWAAGTWGQEFHALYLLPGRKLQQSEYDGTRYNREKTLATAIVNICFANDLPTKERDYHRLREHIQEELKKPTTLVILDGLDERAGASQEILKQAQAGSHKLLMLSRPHGISIERRIATIEIDHTGFSPEQLKAYVREAISDGKLTEELLGYIQQHKHICLLAHVPVNLQLLCALWKEPDHGAPAELGQDSLAGPSNRFSEWISNRYTKGWDAEAGSGLTAKQLQGSIAKVLQALQAPKDAALPAAILQHSQRIERMLSQLKQTLRQIAPTESLKAQEIANISQLSSYILLAKLTHFVKRTAITEQLSATLADKGVCVLHGFGGAGKSTLASHYGHARKDTQTVRWIGAEDSLKLQGGYQQLAQELGVDYQSLATKLAGGCVKSPQKSKK